MLLYLIKMDRRRFGDETEKIGVFIILVDVFELLI